MTELELAPEYRGRRRRIQLAALPWGEMPRPLKLLIAANIFLLLPLPLLWPALFGLSPTRYATWISPPTSAAQVRSAPEERRLRPQVAGRSAAAPELLPALPLLIDAHRLRWAPGFGVVEAAEELERHPLPGFGEGAAQRRQLAHVLIGQGVRWGINPQVLLVLLELQTPALGGMLPLPDTRSDSDSYKLSAANVERTVARLARDLRSGLFEQPGSSLPLSDGFVYAVPSDIDLSSFALVQVLAQKATRRQLQHVLSDAPGSFIDLFTQRFDDPRRPPRSMPRDRPFLQRPFTGSYPATARFDHHYPNFLADGTMLGGPDGEGLGYDGHNGWDYTMPEGTPIRAAANGYVLFAGTMDNECATPAGAVIVEHENGYRTLYWHVRKVTVAAGEAVAAGDMLGENGATGCASGPHLHFGVQRMGRDIDPYGWCGSATDPWAEHPAGAPSFALWRDQRSLCPLPTAAIVADDGDTAMAIMLGDGWYRSADGNGGGAHFTYIRDGATQATMIWRPLLPRGGRYRCYAFVPGSATDASEATYHITSASGTSSVVVDQGRMAGSWVSLGAYSFAAGQQGRIELRDSVGRPGAEVWVDAVACAAEA